MRSAIARALVGGASTIMFAAAALHAAPLPDAVSLQTFAAPPTIEDPELSPDGTKIAAKMLVGGKQTLVVVPLTGGQPHAIDPGKLDYNWWSWVNDDWLVVGIGDSAAMYGFEVYTTRLVGIRADMGKMVKIDWQMSGLDADDVLWSARDGSSKIVFQKQTGLEKADDWNPSVFEADVSTGSVRKILDRQDEIFHWLADGAGNIRFGIGQNSEEKAYLIYRASNGDRFQRLPKLYGVDDTIPIPLVYKADGSAIVVSDAGGFHQAYQLALPSLQLGAPLYSVPGYDVDDVVLDKSGSDVAGFTYVDKRSRTHWVDPDLQDIQRGLDTTLGVGNSQIVSWSRDRQRLLVRVGKASQAGGYYFWDTRGAAMKRIGWINNTLKERELSPVKSVRYKARDGTEIEAVLTLPRGREAKGLPLIVMPHGGPHARDEEQYDWWVQFLAEQGYAVIQPNYRGSTGYGAAFKKLGEGQWGLKMQDDLLDAVDWAAGQGMVDPKRVCIVGASYGGYAAMRGAQRDGGRYRCAVSYSGISDLSAMMKYDRHFLTGAKWAKSYWKKQTSDFAAVSPRFHATQFSAPILIAHGVEDKRVPIKQSRMLADALRGAGKPFEYLEQKKGDHHFSRQEDREQFLKAMKAFLDKHNPA